MKLRRTVSALGLSLTLVLGTALAQAEPTQPPAADPAPVPTSEPAPQPEPEPPAQPEPTAPPTTTPASPAPTQQPTPTPTRSPSPTLAPTAEPTSEPRPTRTPQRPSTPQPSRPSGPAPSPGFSQPEPLSAVDISAQLAEADALLRALTQDNEKMAELMAELEGLTDEANAALEEKVVAEEASRSATARATNALSKAHRLGLELENKQQLLRDWAFNAYVEGGAAAEMMAVFDAMMTDPEGAGNPVGDLNYLTEERIRLVDDIRVITENKEAAAEVAQSESARARAEAVKASQAEAKAKAAVDRHSEVIEQAQGGQVDILTDAAPLAVMLVGMQSPEAKQRGEAILEALIENNIEIPEVGRPCSDDESTYANGTLPATALCPLWGAEQHRARPGAAVAFNALSQKFAQDFGRPICVTDSYRTFADQVSVKARRGHWAATPGTSRHGLGMALDLCGGINNFGTIEHLWMKRNAPLYGWYHPSWAAAGGRLPEPWHWEYAG